MKKIVLLLCLGLVGLSGCESIPQGMALQVLQEAKNGNLHEFRAGLVGDALAKFGSEEGMHQVAAAFSRSSKLTARESTLSDHWDSGHHYYQTEEEVFGSGQSDAITLGKVYVSCDSYHVHGAHGDQIDQCLVTDIVLY